MPRKKKTADVQARFGERLRSLRKARGYSQEGFAALSDMDRTYISGVERGVRNITLKNLEIIACTLELSISELMEDV